MTAPLDLDAIRARYGDWYGSDDDTERGADWSLRDEGETLSHCIVREDVPALLEEVERLRVELGHARMDRAVQADEAQRARDHLAGLDRIAKVTPCTCSAQRTRAEKAEAERDRLAADLVRLDESHKRQAGKLRRVRVLVEEANEWRPVVSRDEGECFPAVVVDDLIENIRAALEGTDS